MIVRACVALTQPLYFAFTSIGIARSRDTTVIKHRKVQVVALDKQNTEGLSIVPLSKVEVL